MDVVQELNGIAVESDRLAEMAKQPPLKGTIETLETAIDRVGESSSNSWIGYQSRVYYRDFQRPQSGDYFSVEWGLTNTFSRHVSDNWQEVSYEEVYDQVMKIARGPDTSVLETRSRQAAEVFEQNRDELLNILNIALETTKSSTVEELRDELRNLKLFTDAQFIDALAPEQIMTRDRVAIDQGRMPPHHIRIHAWLLEQRLPFQRLRELAKLSRRAASFIERKQRTKEPSPNSTCVFIGHGRDPQWKDVADFIQNRLHISVDEFNRESAAGLTTKERLEIMLGRATFAFLIMTAEDEHADKTKHARENVIHEIGLFQTKLGFRRAIVLLEEGCREFSNIAGLNQIRFPCGVIKATFEEIRQVLEREGVITVG